MIREHDVARDGQALPALHRLTLKQSTRLGLSARRMEGVRQLQWVLSARRFGAEPRCLIGSPRSLAGAQRRAAAWFRATLPGSGGGAGESQRRRCTRYRGFAPQDGHRSTQWCPPRQASAARAAGWVSNFRSRRSGPPEPTQRATEAEQAPLIINRFCPTRPPLPGSLLASTPPLAMLTSPPMPASRLITKSEFLSTLPPWRRWLNLDLVAIAPTPLQAASVISALV